MKPPERRSGSSTRPLSVLMLVALASAWQPIAAVGASGTHQQVGGPAVPAGVAAGQITARNGAFWLGTQKILLHGFDVPLSTIHSGTISAMASAGANVFRYWTLWADLEPTPPTNIGGVWHHTYNDSYLNTLRTNITSAYQSGVYSIIDNHPCTGGGDPYCGYFHYPSWLYQSGYNSHGMTYPQTVDGNTQAQTDFWSDSLRQRFLDDMWKHVATALVGVPGIAGYEVQNEPQQGSLADSHDTTQMILNWELSVAADIRSIDPGRVIFFTTRGGNGLGLPQADLSGWTTMGNVAFDLHDYFGARWGDGFLENTASPQYGESVQSVFDLTVVPASDNYIGTAVSQALFINRRKNLVGNAGIPLFVGELGAYSDNPGVFTYYGTTMGALARAGVSWAAFWGGDLGIMNNDTSPRPYAYLVLQAM